MYDKLTQQRPIMKVLIFEDDRDTMEVCKIILRKKGYEVEGYTYISDPVRQVKNASPDVILMDNLMPEIGGCAATKILKKNCETACIPVILFSTVSNIKDIAKECGADRYLLKPFELTDLLTQVRAAVKMVEVK